MARPPRPTLDQLLDVFVYAPVGALIAVADEFPDAIRRGKEKLEPQINVVRSVAPSMAKAAQTGVQERLRNMLFNEDETKSKAADSTDEPSTIEIIHGDADGPGQVSDSDPES